VSESGQRRRGVPQRQPLRAGDGQKGRERIRRTTERRRGVPQRQPLRAGDKDQPETRDARFGQTVTKAI